MYVKHKYNTLEEVQPITLDELCNQFVKGLAGITAGPNLVPLRSFMKNTNLQHTYYIHLSTDSTAAG